MMRAARTPARSLYVAAPLGLAGHLAESVSR
jgi:hypothetical protein